MPHVQRDGAGEGREMNNRQIGVIMIGAYAALVAALFHYRYYSWAVLLFVAGLYAEIRDTR